MTQEHDAETVERVAKAIWDEIRDLEDRCDMEWDDMPRDHTHFVSARAALSAMPAREVKGWQPIETAPKDGAILFYASGYYVGHFNTAYEKWCTYTDGTKTSGERMLNSWNSPTHWKPLDPPPEGV